MADSMIPTETDAVNTYYVELARRAMAAAEWRALVAECAARGDE